MKRFTIVIILSLLIASAFVSCKSSEHCPAYGTGDQQQTAQKV
jgi:hypothetical protein